jgi:hypothetical protein
MLHRQPIIWQSTGTDWPASHRMVVLLSGELPEAITVMLTPKGQARRYAKVGVRAQRFEPSPNPRTCEVGWRVLREPIS